MHAPRVLPILFLLLGKLPGDAMGVFHIVPAVDAPRHCHILAGIGAIGADAGCMP